MKEAGVGLLGFGTVGAGVVDGLQRNAPLLAARLGVLPVLRKIADLDLESDRGVRVPDELLTRDAASVVGDPDVDIVVELIGGTGAARDLVKQALAAGKPVVTANKALLAEFGEELFGLAARNGTDIYFGASVGGGIPIIRALKRGLIANSIESLCGILNGTCNYILTRMETEGVPFDRALADAQAEGYAEADPGLDIDGHDTAHKAVLLASIAYGFHVPLDAVSVEGIRGLSEQDIHYGLDLGYRIKLLAVMKRIEGTAGAAGTATDVEVRVHPAMVRLDHMLASVNGVFNAVMVQGDLTGPTLYYGRGAGRAPTASTVIADIADAACGAADPSSAGNGPLAWSPQPVRVRHIGETVTRYYLRLALLDRPGVLARIASVLGTHEISLASMLQKEMGAGEHVPVVILTHMAMESRVDAALREINALDVVGPGTVKIRIEE